MSARSYPNGWCLIPIRQIGKVVTGNTPPKEYEGNYGEAVLWVSPTDIGSGKYVATTRNMLSSEGAKLARIVPIGAVLVTCIASIGKNAIASKTLCTNQQINSIVVGELYCNEYVYYCIEYHGIPLLKKYAGRTAVPIVSKGLFEKLYLPFPESKKEQQKIAAFLNAVDEMLDIIKRNIETTQLLKQGLMQTLFSRGVASGWPVLPLSKVAEVRTGVAKGNTGLKDPVELPYLRVANVQDGHIDLGVIKNICVESTQIDRYALQAGDVLMTEGGDFDKLGRGDVWNAQISPCLHQNHVFAVRPDARKLNSYYLAALSASSYGKKYFISCAKRTTNLASINSTQLKAFPVPLPPIEEQLRIAEIVGATNAKIKVLQAKKDHYQTLKRGLMQKLLTGEWRVKLDDPTPATEQ